MTFLAFPLSPFGRASPRAFAVAVGIAYLAGFASQAPLAALAFTMWAATRSGVVHVS